MVTIDLKHVNESAPYALRLAPYAQLSYILTTDYGVNYTLSFMPSDLMPEIEAYEFAISNTNHRKSPRDPKLRQSILTLVYEFFRTREAVMLYLCETGDNRQKHRSRLFESWFRASGHQTTFAFLSAQIPDEEGISNFVALIVRPDHPRFAFIAQQFSDTIELFRDNLQPIIPQRVRLSAPK